MMLLGMLWCGLPYLILELVWTKGGAWRHSEPLELWLPLGCVQASVTEIH